MSKYVHIWLYSLPKKHQFFLLPILFILPPSYFILCSHFPSFKLYAPGEDD